MRTLAVGDIHGCYRSLDALASFAAFASDDRIITLGDYVDRGPDSRRVIEWMIERHETGSLIPLRGNHELMMLAARESERHYDEWLSCGGDTVLSSYGTDKLDNIPDCHWHFLAKSLRSHFCTKTTSSSTQMHTLIFQSMNSRTSCFTGNHLVIQRRMNLG